MATLPSAISARLRPAIGGVQRARVLGGWVALIALLASVLVASPGWPGLVLAGIATIGLAGSHRFGWVGAAAVVALGVPFGVSASTGPATLGDVPLSPQAIAIALGVLGMLPAVRWPAPVGGRVLLVAVSVFIAIGGMATILGLAGHHPLRDVLRDLRWWGIYALPAVVILTQTRRGRVLRGLAVGATVFAVMVIVTAVTPTFEGGLKDAVLTYWYGNLRLQMANSAFLTPIVVLVGWRWLHRPSVVGLGWLTILATAQVMSLTRLSLVVLVLVIVALAVSQPSWTSGLWSRLSLRRIALAIGLPVAAFLIGVELVGYGTPAGPSAARYSPSRLTFGDAQRGLGGLVNPSANQGRFSTYANALIEITRSPIVGSGMGELVFVSFANRDFQANTPQQQPGVDDAPLTVGVKAGALGIAAFGALLLLPLWRAARLRGLRGWYLLAWLSLLAVMLSQSFAVSGYGPFGVGLLMVLPFLDP